MGRERIAIAMKALGISPPDKDAAVSFVEEGKILFAAGDERYSRQKQHAGFPYQALADGLRYLGRSPKDLDIVAYAFLLADREEAMMDENVGQSLQRQYATNWRGTLNAARQGSSRYVVDGVLRLSNIDETLEKSWPKKEAYWGLGQCFRLPRTAISPAIGLVVRWQLISECR